MQWRTVVIRELEFFEPEMEPTFEGGLLITQSIREGARQLRRRQQRLNERARTIARRRDRRAVRRFKGTD